MAILMTDEGEVVGRERELAALEAFLEPPPEAPAALVVEGEAGIGKTTLWLAGVKAARERGFQVLTAAPAEAERELALTAVGDLLGGALDTTLDKLPLPQRRALEVALLLDEGRGRPPDRRAVSLAFLTTLRQLALAGPLLVAIDDVQWLDSASGAVLGFAARRLKGEQAGFLLFSRRTEPRADLAGMDGAFEERRVRRLQLGPLTLGALTRLLRLRLQVTFPRPTLERLHQLSAGNPFYAIELGRALRDGTLRFEPGLRLPVDLRRLVGARIEGLPHETRHALAVAAAAAAPTLGLVGAVTGAVPEQALQPAVEGNVVVVEDELIRFTHPLLASAAYGSISARQRRELHASLAASVDSAEERARHLALASTGPDEGVAATLEAVAHRVRSRGAPEMAAELLDQAYAMTPAEDAERRTLRRMHAADYHLEAGDTLRARSLLEEAVAMAPSGRLRADALVHLAWAFAHELGYRRAAELFGEAATHAGDDLRIRTSIERGLAWCTHHEGNLTLAEVHAQAALQIAERIPDPAGLAVALADVAFHQFLLGRGVPEAIMTRALALERETSEHLEIMGRPSWIQGMLLEWSGDLDGARSQLELLYSRAAEIGDANALPFIAVHLARVAQRAGRLEEARRFAEEASGAVLETGQGSERAFVLATGALIDVQLGRVEEARQALGEGLRISESGSRPALFELLSVLGFLELSLGKPDDAMAAFGRLMRDVPAAGFADPGLNMRFQADAVEALVELGRLDEAEILTDELEELGRRLDRPWALATSARSHGLLLSARGHTLGALDRLAVALAEHERVGEPFELGRTLLVRGVIARRARQKRLARESLEAALDLFERLPAPLWAAKARADLARIGGRRPSGSSLTSTERQLAALVAEGLTNREAAARMFVTEHTVETSLVRIYAKLGVRSRTELAGRLASGQTAD